MPPLENSEKPEPDRGHSTSPARSLTVFMYSRTSVAILVGKLTGTLDLLRWLEMVVILFEWQRKLKVVVRPPGRLS
jgi:hypothetical protein